jgi:chromosome segregation ATPase
MSSKKDKAVDKSVAGWKRALAEAERQISQYKRKLHELNESVRIMQEKITSGAPWPGQLDGQKSEQQHSV